MSQRGRLRGCLYVGKLVQVPKPTRFAEILPAIYFIVYCPPPPPPGWAGNFSHKRSTRAGSPQRAECYCSIHANISLENDFFDRFQSWNVSENDSVGYNRESANFRFVRNITIYSGENTGTE